MWVNEACTEGGRDTVAVCACVCAGVGGWVGAVRTEQRDQYIISYKLNSTWIDPEDVCDRLRTVDECTVNPTDQYEGQREGVGGRGNKQGCPPSGGSPPKKRA